MWGWTHAGPVPCGQHLWRAGGENRPNVRVRQHNPQRQCFLVTCLQPLKGRGKLTSGVSTELGPGAGLYPDHLPGREDAAQTCGLPRGGSGLEVWSRGAGLGQGHTGCRGGKRMGAKAPKSKRTSSPDWPCGSSRPPALRPVCRMALPSRRLGSGTPPVGRASWSRKLQCIPVWPQARLRAPILRKAGREPVLNSKSDQHGLLSHVPRHTRDGVTGLAPGPVPGLSFPSLTDSTAEGPQSVAPMGIPVLRQWGLPGATPAHTQHSTHGRRPVICVD